MIVDEGLKAIMVCLNLLVFLYAFVGMQRIEKE